MSFPVYHIADFLGTPGQPMGFGIERLEALAAAPPRVQVAHKHDFYEIMWVTRGRSHQTIDYEEYHLGPGSLFIISPGQLHLFEKNDDVAGYCLLFTEDFFLLNHQDPHTLFELSYLDHRAVAPVLHLSASQADKLHTLVQLLLTEHQQFNSSDEVLRALLFVLLTEIQRLYTSGQVPLPDIHWLAVFKQFRALVERQFAENRPVSDYAQQLSLTVRHLNRVVQSVAAQTATDIIRHRVVLEAKRLLTYTDLNVTQVAEALGFYDSAYFARYFKRATGAAPLHFRSTMVKKYRNPLQ